MDDNRGTGTTTDTDTEDKPRGRGCGCWILLLLVLVGGGLATAGLMGTIVLREETPLPGEVTMTDLGLRMVAIPGEFQDMRRPSGPKISTARGKELYTVQCAICHGQDGKATVDLGKNMYPPAANMLSERVRTKTDGQLYWILAHGINLSGMPAWGNKYGGANSDEDIWSMVQYMRETFHGEKPRQ